MKHILAICALSLTATCALAQTVTPTQSPSAPAAIGSPATATQTLPNGVQVAVSQKGKGAAPGARSIVRVHYRGTLENGREFDSSYNSGKPVEFPLNGVISCWTTGIVVLNVGSKARLTCPPETAYGARGIPGVIPPNATLYFDVELISIQ